MGSTWMLKIISTGKNIMNLLFYIVYVDGPSFFLENISFCVIGSEIDLYIKYFGLGINCSLYSGENHVSHVPNVIYTFLQVWFSAIIHLPPIFSIICYRNKYALFKSCCASFLYCREIIGNS